MNKKTVVVLAPHTDDGELGCGGSIVKLENAGYDIHYVAFCAPTEELEEELKEAATILGVVDVIILNFTLRHFHSQRQEILDFMVKLNKELEPGFVLMPSKHDIHQDHQIIYNEGLRAFKKTTIYSYELPWNHLQFDTEAFIALEHIHLKKKIKALGCYQTQKSRDYLDEQFVKGLARVRGVQIGRRYAECFEVVRKVQ